MAKKRKITTGPAKYPGHPSAATHVLEKLPDAIRTKPTYVRHNVDGEELLDPTPLQPPLGYKKAPSLHEQIAQQVRAMKLELALADGDITESDEEADDFEVGDDFEPLSPHENDHIPSIKTLKKRAKEINDQIKEANRRAAIAAHENALKKPQSVTTPPGQPAGDVNTKEQPKT